MARLAYPAVDSDNHYYEPVDSFTRHIEARFRERTLRPERRSDGDFDVFLDNRPWRYTDPKFERTNRPGSMIEILHRKGDVQWKDSYTRENMLAGYQNRDSRLELMDEQGLQAAILLPTLGVVVEHGLRHDVELTYASLRAFNRWIEDDWGYAYRERIFAPPLMSLLDIDACVEELERVLAAGARLVHLRPGPADGRSPAHPDYDPFWARLNEAGVPVVFHISESGYNELFSVAWGEEPNPSVREQSAFQWAFMHGDRPIMETLGALIYHNLFTRFPRLKVLSIENGSGWVQYLLTNLDKKKGMARYGPWLAGRPKGRPSDIFRRHCCVSPYPEDDVPGLIDFLGEDNVLFGSDYPHPEGIREPLDFTDLIGPAPDERIRRIMRENTAELLKL